MAELLAATVADSDLDMELAFPSEDGTETETVMLSAWLASLAGRPAQRYVPRPLQSESAAALHLIIDRFIDVGPRSLARSDR